uniref:Uncharacterized protein n=1 Tax=Schistocephalus solidus TaxID=70667 RepID=A0A0X3P3L5_SCHSO
MFLRMKRSYILILLLLISFSARGGATDEMHPAGELRLLVYTLRGEFLLVDRITGKVLWQHLSGFATECNYSGGPIILPDPLNGWLYVYSNVPSKDILYSINSTVADLVSRSPEFLNSLYSTGYKSDHWLHFDLASGRLIKNTNNFPADDFHSKTESGLGTVFPSEADRSIWESKNQLAVGISQYHFTLWDLISGRVKFNMTYQVLSSQAEPDFQSSTNLTHVATLQPSVVTFSGTKFLWRLPLSSPVVDLFTVFSPTLKEQQPAGPLVPVSGTRSLAAVPKTNTASQYLFDDAGDERQADADESLPSADSSRPRLAYQLRRLIFTTYALDLNATFYAPHLPSFVEAALWEDKFCGTLSLVPALYIGGSEKAPLYAIRTISEASLNRRATHRVSERLWLTASAAVEALQHEIHSNDSSIYDLTVTLMRQHNWDDGNAGAYWPKSLFGLYELSADSPRVDPSWSPKPHTSNRLFRITDASPSHDAIILPGSPLSTGLQGAQASPDAVAAPTFLALPLLLAVLLCVGCLVLPVAGLLWARNRALKDLSHNSPTLPASFDSPDASGWAGHTADSLAHPGVVRFNINHVLGRGSNGTIVFDGFYGSQPAAIKRILRQPVFEKSWLREHNILLQHHHEHLIRCYWTGSSPNFHYLVLQRCEKSLLDVFSGTAVPSLHPLLSFNLGVIQSLYQLATAISFLHSSGVVHRDIKPGNVFLLHSAAASGGQFRLVLGDFGLSLPVQNGHFQNSFTLIALAGAAGGTKSMSTDCGLIQFGSLGWMAPEMAANSADLTPAVDVFAYGLVAFFILSAGRHPFDLEKPADMEAVDEEVLIDRSKKEAHSVALAASSSFHTLQSIQMAINDCHQPALRSLSEHSKDLGGGKIPDRMAQFLAQQLVQEALISAPSQRPPIDVLTKSPLFWSADEVMTFYTELSNFLDEPKPLRTNGLVRRSYLPAAPAPTLWETEMDDLQRKRRFMLADLQKHSSRVFSSSWLRHLDPLLVEDLRSVRSYQENSLVHLLRAVRNKRSHIWTLNPRVRTLIGETDAAMANHWNSRFPSLLPVLTCLARCHLHDVPQFQRFWPLHEGTGHALSTERACELLQFCEPSVPAKWARMQVSPENEVPPPRLECSTAASEEEEAGVDDNATVSLTAASMKTKRTRRRRPRELPKA